LKRKLIILNLVLAALAGAAAWRLRVEWLNAKRHEEAILRRHIPPAPAPPYSPLQKPAALVPVQYADIAQKDLFSKDRNPTVVVEKPAPPPPPPMPPLPIVRGVLNFDGITAIMSEDKKTQPKEVRTGDKIGQFTLVALNTQELVLEWNGQQVRKPINELMDHTIPEPAAAPAPAAAAAPAPAQTQITAKSGPGVDIGQGRKACIPGDTTPVGTVMDGLRKVTMATPFGEACVWETPK
jgi:hypothetical protein